MGAAKSKKTIFLIGYFPSQEGLFREALEAYTLTFLSISSHTTSEVARAPCDLVFLNHRTDSSPATLKLVREINRTTQTGIPIVLTFDQGLEKIAVEALKEGVVDSVTTKELVPSIITMVATRTIEHKKWENLYHVLRSDGKKSSLKDPVTETFNLPYFEMRVAEEIDRSRRYDYPVTLVLLNVDEFSEVNKVLGKKGGDSLLRELAQLVSADLRFSDLVTRLEDDQFALLLPHTALEQSEALWKRLASNIQSHPFRFGEKNLFITVRAALVPLNRDIEKIDALLKRIEKVPRHTADAPLPVLQLTKSETSS